MLAYAKWDNGAPIGKAYALDAIREIEREATPTPAATPDPEEEAWMNAPMGSPAATPDLRAALLTAIRGWVEPYGSGTARDYGNPQGIHVDESEDIPAFLDAIIAALAAPAATPERALERPFGSFATDKDLP